MSRPVAEVQADIRLQQMLRQMEEQGRSQEDLTEEEMMQLRADLAISGKSEEQEAIAAFQEQQQERYGPYPEREERATSSNPFDQFRMEPVAPVGVVVNPFDQFMPEQDDIVELELSPFPEERGTSRASIQLPEIAQIGMDEFLPDINFHIGPDMEAIEAAGGYEALMNQSAYSGAAPMIPMKVEGMGQLASNMGTTLATLTMTDPQEIVNFMTQTVEYEDPETGEIRERAMFPGVSYQTAPDGSLILVNNNRRTASGEPIRALVNRPGFSVMDAMQIGGIGAMFTPAGRGAAIASAPARQAAVVATTETARRAALREARRRSATAMVAGSGATEAVIQGGQHVAGGEFNPGDVAFSAAFGVVPDYVFDPLIRTATKLPSYLRGQVPDFDLERLRHIEEGLQYADATGRRVMTEDVLRQTPARQIFTKIVERIPFVGTGPARRRMVEERVEALQELAERYGIDIESNYGTQLFDDFMKQLENRRFWGANEELINNLRNVHYPASRRAAAQQQLDELIERAFARDFEELSEGVLKRAIANNNIDDTVVDAVMRSNRPEVMTELFERLTPVGRQQVQRRFLLRALEEATFDPTAPAIANPNKFMAFLDSPSSRRVIQAWFSPEDQQVLRGVREYLRVTANAEGTGKGAGMIAAAGGVSFFAGMLDSFLGVGALTAGAGRTYQSDFIRNRLLQLAHTSGDEAATARIMNELRPYMVAAENQWKQDNYYLPEVNINEESMIEAGEAFVDWMATGAKESIGDIAQAPEAVLEFIQGTE